jgi:hypothetical protein
LPWNPRQSVSVAAHVHLSMLHESLSRVFDHPATSARRFS